LSGLKIIPTSPKKVYFCTSLQSETAPAFDGKKPRALRNADNAIGGKSIFIDVDIKESPKGYANRNEAFDAIQAFLPAAKLPPLSALVDSGGGFHLYWISDRVLGMDEWQTYANGLRNLAERHGLRCDLGVTIDRARILRVPGTVNRKTGTPRPVKLLALASRDINFESALSHIRSAGPVRATASRQTARNLVLFDAPTRPPITDPDYIAECGVSQSYDDNLDPRPLVAHNGCPFLQETFRTGGKDQDQGLWMMTGLLTTFLSGGRAIFHEMSKGYKTYDPGETDKMFDRKAEEREEKDLGWPSCDKFQAFGAKQCAVCPHRGKIKSPLNLAAANPAQTNYASSNNHWPRWEDPLNFHQVSEDEAIARVNAAGYFVLTLNGDIYKIELGGGIIVQKREGLTNLFACRQARLANSDLVSAVIAWKNSPNRSEYDRIGYWPGDHGRPPKTYNLWRGWGIKPKQGDWSIIRDHILNVIASANEGKANYVLNWCAHMVQRPWEKPGVALVLKGRKGTGKTLLTLLVSRVIGEPNTLITANGKKLFDTFNWFLADKLLIGAEEAFFVGNRELNDKLKHLLTGDEIEVEQKFGQRISIKSMHRVIMTSNHDQVVAASDDERRFFVCDVSDKRRGDDTYFAPLIRIIKGDDDATVAAFMYELQTRDIKDWKPEQAARKAASTDLARQKLLSLEAPLQWLLETKTSAPAAAAHKTADDIGKPGAADLEMDRIVQQVTSNAEMDPNKQATSIRELRKDQMLDDYRSWVKISQVRGAADFTGPEIFWNSIRRVLNKEIFPGRRLFRSSGGVRFVLLPSPQELLDGFNRLLGAKVIDCDDQDEFGEQAREQVHRGTCPA
jgi:hypothetical protein